MQEIHSGVLESLGAYTRRSVTERDDQEAIDWLAEQTGQSRDAIEKGFEEGRLRRRAVVTELVEAGIVGPLLLELVVRLTGLAPDEARELIAVEAPEALEVV